MIYFDNAATTKPNIKAIEAFNQIASTSFGNSSSLHKLGIESERIINNSERVILNKLAKNNLKMKSGKFIFTSGATEANNMAIFGIANTYSRMGKKIITTSTEHSSSAKALLKLEQSGFDVIRLNPYDCVETNTFEEKIAELVDETTILVSVIAVNNETGFTTDTSKLYSLVKRKNPKTIVHIDGVQAFCKFSILGDLISVSAHKIHGLKGIGGLYVGKDVRISPLILGGSHQYGLRAGTLPTELVHSFAKSVEDYPSDFTHIDELCSYLREKLGQFERVVINSKNAIPHILNFSVVGIPSEIILHFMEENGIYISSGSACSKGKKSEVLTGFGLADNRVSSALRISFSHENTRDEIDNFIEVLEIGINRFSKLT